MQNVAYGAHPVVRREEHTPLLLDPADDGHAHRPQHDERMHSTELKAGVAAFVGFFLCGFVAAGAFSGQGNSLWRSSSLTSSESAAAGLTVREMRSLVTDPSPAADDDVWQRDKANKSNDGGFSAELKAFLESPASGEASGYRFTSDSTSLDIVLENDYTRVRPIDTGREFTYPWKYFAETYKPTRMSVIGAKSTSSYKWIVDGHVQGFGSSVDVNFPVVGYHDVVVVEKANAHDEKLEGTMESGQEVHAVAFKVMVKYTRREVRSLTDLDREKFFTAMQIMSRVPTTVGQQLHGENYKSKDYFNRVHLYFGATKDCDHWHQGAGFVTSHVTFTLEFEKALQSIYPDLAVPYWDFTLESTFFGAADWRDSKVFSSSWFGHGSPENSLHTVTDGRFGFTRTMTRAEGFSIVTNSYGLLRSPWNNDPTPFMTRSSKVYGYDNNIKPSGCVEYKSSIMEDTWMSLSKQLNAAAHGHIHETVGGAWSYNLYEENNGEEFSAAFDFAHALQATSKILWRSGVLQCPARCSLTTPAADCQCTCPADVLNSDNPAEILFEAGVLDGVSFYDTDGTQIKKFVSPAGELYTTIPGYTEHASKAIYKRLLNSLCHPGHIGDMFQATSSNDVTFWVLHGTLDRLWHYKRLGTPIDETWDPYHTCYGHNPTNFQPFKNIFDSKDQYYRNEELYSLLNPAAETLPYIYAHFDWPHCDKIGSSFSNVVE